MALLSHSEENFSTISALRGKFESGGNQILHKKPSSGTVAIRHAAQYVFHAATFIHFLTLKMYISINTGHVGQLKTAVRVQIFNNIVSGINWRTEQTNRQRFIASLLNDG